MTARNAALAQPLPLDPASTTDVGFATAYGLRAGLGWPAKEQLATAPSAKVGARFRLGKTPFAGVSSCDSRAPSADCQSFDAARAPQ